LATLALLSPLSLRAQVSHPPDSAYLKRATDAGIYLVHWIQKDNSSEHTLYFKNTAAFPLQVTDWEVYECINIGNKDCAAHSDGPLIKPGQTVSITTIRRRDRHSGFSYLYRFHVAWGPGVTVDSAGRTGS
jgi:hypothetical protein